MRFVTFKEKILSPKERFLPDDYSFTNENLGKPNRQEPPEAMIREFPLTTKRPEESPFIVKGASSFIPFDGSETWGGEKGVKVWSGLFVLDAVLRYR